MQAFQRTFTGESVLPSAGRTCVWLQNCKGGRRRHFQKSHFQLSLVSSFLLHWKPKSGTQLLWPEYVPVLSDLKHETNVTDTLSYLQCCLKTLNFLKKSSSNSPQGHHRVLKFLLCLFGLLLVWSHIYAGLNIGDGPVLPGCYCDCLLS
jgi:hypothetical protein